MIVEPDRIFGLFASGVAHVAVVGGVVYGALNTSAIPVEPIAIEIMVVAAPEEAARIPSAGLSGQASPVEASDPKPSEGDIAATQSRDTPDRTRKKTDRRPTDTPADSHSRRAAETLASVTLPPRPSRSPTARPKAAPMKSTSHRAPAPAAPAYLGNGLGNPKPAYPLAARIRGWEGKVLLRIQVSADGSPTAVDVVHSSGFVILDEAARDAIARWRFEPARTLGQPVPGQIDVPVTFRLE